MLQPLLCAAHKATVVAYALIKLEVCIFMKTTQDAATLYFGVQEFSCLIQACECT